jgi:hypothetical protein
MIDAVVIAGLGFKALRFENLRTDVLLERINDINLICNVPHLLMKRSGKT